MRNNTQLIITSTILAAGMIIAAALFTGGGLGAATIGGGIKEFDIIMQNNRYVPSEITVNVGDRVAINFENRDNVGHAVGIAEFNARVPGDHVGPRQRARMEFVADRRIRIDAATCGGPKPSDKTDTHGEELIINVI